jgi:hypothetical protein
MKRLAMIVLAAMASACQPGPDPQGADDERSVETDAPRQAPIQLTLTDHGDDPWHLDIEIEKSQPLIFSRSNGDYRRETMTPITDGVTLDRIGGFDTLIIPEGIKRVRLAVTPYTDYVRADYTPFIPFSDGGLALFTGQFELLRVDNVDAVAALDGSLRNWTGTQIPIPLTLISERTLLAHGAVIEGDARVEVEGDGEYIYLGDAELTEGDAFIGVIDPGLPDWIRETLDDDLSMIFEALSTRFGYELPNRATTLFSFRGYDQPGLSNTGGVLPGNMLALETAGDALREPNPRLRQHFQWFFAHEAVHLFQNESGKFASGHDIAWIHEGGANAMAGRLMIEAGLQSPETYAATLANQFEACAAALSGTTLTDLMYSGTIGPYDCGELIAVASDAAMADHDLYDLWAAMVKASNDADTFDAEDYYTALGTLGADPEIVDQIHALTTDPIVDARSDLLTLLRTAGLNVTESDGRATYIRLSSL